MSKVIIGVHGLSNKPEKAILEKWWKQAMLEGLRNIDNDAEIPEFELVYWADILNKKPLNEHISDKEDICYLDEKYLPAPTNYQPEIHPVRQKVLGILEKKLDEFFLNGNNSSKYSFLSDAVINKYFYELKVYFSDKKTDPEGYLIYSRDLIKSRLIDVLRKYAGYDIMLVTHSMGSVIAYDVLNFILPDVKINTFVTMGSPLGLPMIKAKIATMEHIEFKNKDLMTPSGIQYHWFNFSDPDDKVAFDLTLNDDYSPNENGVRAIDFEVHNNYVCEGIRNPHKSFGYLRTPEFSEMLLNFIHMENNGRSFYKKLWSFFFPKAS